MESNAVEVNAMEVNRVKAQIVDVVVLGDKDERENEMIVNRPLPCSTITSPWGPLQSSPTSSQTLCLLSFRHVDLS